MPGARRTHRAGARRPVTGLPGHVRPGPGPGPVNGFCPPASGRRSGSGAPPGTEGHGYALEHDDGDEQIYGPGGHRSVGVILLHLGADGVYIVQFGVIRIRIECIDHLVVWGRALFNAHPSGIAQDIAGGQRLLETVGG